MTRMRETNERKDGLMDDERKMLVVPNVLTVTVKRSDDEKKKRKSKPVKIKIERGAGGERMYL